MTYDVSTRKFVSKRVPNLSSNAVSMALAALTGAAMCGIFAGVLFVTGALAG